MLLTRLSTLIQCRICMVDFSLAFYNNTCSGQQPGHKSLGLRTTRGPFASFTVK